MYYIFSEILHCFPEEKYFTKKKVFSDINKNFEKLEFLICLNNNFFSEIKTSATLFYQPSAIIFCC